MKVSKKLIQQLLDEYIQDVEIVDDETPDIKGEDLQTTIQAKVTEAIKPAIEQELRNGIRTDVAGEMASMERKHIAKAFQLADKKVLEGLSFEQMLTKSKEILASNLKMNVDDWNKEKENLVTQHLTEKESWEKSLADTNTQWETKYSQRDVDAHIMGMLEKIPRKGGDLAIQAKMYKGYISDNGLTPKFNKEKNKLDFYKENQLYIEDGKTIEDVKHAKEWAKQIGILAESTNHIPPSEINPKTGEHTQPKNGKDPYAALKTFVGAETAQA